MRELFIVAVLVGFVYGSGHLIGGFIHAQQERSLQSSQEIVRIGK
jgi:hypothetical protein